MPNRRNLLFGLAAAFTPEAEAMEEEHGTIYIPDKHSEKDRPFLLNFMDEFSFAMIVTGQPSVQITNVPTVLERAPDGGWGKIWWHLAKANPQNAAMDGSVTVVFHGPHEYISPNWYRTANAVPTWNFAVVHVTGSPRRVESDAELAAGLRTLVKQNESRYGGGDRWDFEKLPDSYLKGMRAGIVAYEMKIEKVEAKFKLGQERPEADQAGILEGLRKSPKERNLFELTKAYYRRGK
jgi:transcriptional regulator